MTIKAVIGAMKADKSKSLIEQAQLLQEIGITPKIFYPSFCNKYEGHVFSRSGNKKIRAIKVYEVADLFGNISDDTKWVLIDEFQFICSRVETQDFVNFLEFCDKKGINVMLYGLAFDYMSNVFDVTQAVLPFCDKIEVKTAICECCGNDANRCVRYVNGQLDCDINSDLLVMEGEDVVYKSVCKDCYRKLTGFSAIKFQN